MQKKQMVLSFALAFGASVLNAQAANLNNGDSLSITAGVPTYGAQKCTTTTSGGQVCTAPVTAFSGSWFGMDTSANSIIENSEKTALAIGPQGIIIGTVQAGSGSHGGAATGSEVSPIVSPWAFYGNTGLNYTTVAITGGTTGLDLSGWTVAWNGIENIPMTTRAWGTGFTNGVAKFTWDGTYGHGYTLDYRATVPHGDPSGFGDVKYALHLVGTVYAKDVVSSVLPVVNEANASPTLSSMSVTFNNAVNVSSGFVTINNGVTATPQSCTGVTTCTFTLSGIAIGTTYTVTLDGTKATNPLNAQHPGAGSFASYQFTTGTVADTTPPAISSVSPSNGATGVVNTSTVQVTFSEPMLASTASAITVSAGSTAVQGTVTANATNTVFTFTPQSPLSNNTTYTVRVAGGASASAAKDASNNALAAASTTTFSTSASTSLTASFGTDTATVSVADAGANMVSLSVDSTAGGTPPSGIAFTDGIVNYTVNGVSGSATVTITFPLSIAGKTLYKVTGSGASTVYTAISEATAGCTFSRGGDGRSITMSIVDNGACDSDATAGTITDPIAAASAIVTAPTGLTSAGTSGGGCAMSVSRSGHFDPTLLLAVLGGWGYVGWRRRLPE